jgi:O-antigen/teichoic acid export membrane protein
MQIVEKTAETLKRQFPAGSLRARMARGTSWLVLGTLTLQLSAMLGAILSARILGKDGFGKLNILRSTILMFGVLAGSGLGVIATKYVSEFRDTEPDRAGKLLGLVLKISLLTGASATVACFFLASPIAGHAMNSIGLTNSLRLGSMLLLLNALNGVQMGVLCGFESFRLMSGLTILDALLSLILIPLGAYLFGVIGAVGGIVAGTVISFPIKHGAMKRECRRKNVVISFVRAKTDLAEITKTILPIMLLGIGFYPFEWLSKIFLARRPGGFSQLGLFAAAYSFGSIVLFVPNQLLSTTQPFLGNMVGKKDMRAFRRLSLFSVALTGGVGLLIAGVLAVLSKQLMRAYGATFVEAAGVLVVMSFGYVFYALLTPYYKMHIARNKIWAQASFIVLLGLSLVGSAYALTSRGALGLAYSYFIAWFLTFAVQSFFVWRMIGPNPRIEATPDL